MNSRKSYVCVMRFAKNPIELAVNGKDCCVDSELLCKCREQIEPETFNFNDSCNQ